MDAEYQRQIKRMEEVGSIDRDCVTCQKDFYSVKRPADVFGPRHRAMPNCESGKHPHCTCDTCF